MEELLEAIVSAVLASLVLVVMATWYGLKFLGLAGLATFSPRYRQKLREGWKESKVMMITGVGLYFTALTWAGLFWWDMSQPSATEARPVAVENLPLTDVELAELRLTRTIPELMEKARELGERMRKEGRLPVNLEAGVSPEPHEQEP